MGTYSYTSGTYQATYSTTNPTTLFNDGSPGDTSTGQAGNNSTSSVITGFYDNGSVALLTVNQFTSYCSSLSSGIAGAWILESSTDSISWSTVASGTNNGKQANPALAVTVTSSGLSVSCRYLRKSVKVNGGAAVINFLSDWRPTFLGLRRRGGQIIVY